MVAVPLGQPHRFTGSFPQKIQLGTPGLAASDRFDIENIRAVNREYSLDTFIANDPANRKHLVDTTPLTSDDSTVENLCPDLTAFFDPAVNFDNITYLEVRNLLL